MIDEVEIYCDGSYYPGCQHGGWAFGIYLGEECLKRDSGTSYNGLFSGGAWEAEFVGCVRAIQCARRLKASTAIVYTDHQDAYRSLGGGLFQNDIYEDRKIKAVIRHRLWPILRRLLEEVECTPVLLGPGKKQNPRHRDVHNRSKLQAQPITSFPQFNEPRSLRGGLDTHWSRNRWPD